MKKLSIGMGLLVLSLAGCSAGSEKGLLPSEDVVYEEVLVVEVINEIQMVHDSLLAEIDSEGQVSYENVDVLLRELEIKMNSIEKNVTTVLLETTSKEALEWIKSLENVAEYANAENNKEINYEKLKEHIEKTENIKVLVDKKVAKIVDEISGKIQADEKVSWDEKRSEYEEFLRDEKFQSIFNLVVGLVYEEDVKEVFAGVGVGDIKQMYEDVVEVTKDNSNEYITVMGNMLKELNLVANYENIINSEVEEKEIIRMTKFIYIVGSEWSTEKVMKISERGSISESEIDEMYFEIMVENYQKRFLEMYK